MKKLFVLCALVLSFCSLMSYGQSDYNNLKIKERNAMNILLNENGRLLVNGRPSDLSLLKEEVKHFVSPNIIDDYFPEVEMKTIDPIGDCYVTKAVVFFSCQSDSQEEYMNVINELAKAYGELREEWAYRKFYAHLDQITDPDKRRALQQVVPIRVIEFDTSIDLGFQIVTNDAKADDIEINNQTVERTLKQFEKKGLLRPY